MTRHAFALLAATALAGTAASAAALQQVSLMDSFRIGTGGSAICTAQSMASGAALTDMFDRGWSIVCRDAAVPVGQLYALRTRAGDPLARLAELRAQHATCGNVESQTIEGLGSVSALSCTLDETDVGYRVYWKPEGGVLYVAEGFAGYDSALRIGLRSVVEDRPVEGEVSVATTGAGDPAAFARVQAGSLDPQRALAEAYRRNNAGSFAESAEFFATLSEADGDDSGQAEALLNEALQRSNLGDYGEAEALFARAEGLAAGDLIDARRLRNYRAMHLLNRGRPGEALDVLNRPLPEPARLGSAAMGELAIDAATAARLSAESGGRLGAAQGLTREEKARILDAQAQHLRGAVHRIQGRPGPAAAALDDAIATLDAIRGERLPATEWMRAQILGERGEIAEARGDAGEAERLHRAAIDLLTAEYPGSSALLSAQGRLAAFYARNGRPGEAATLYRSIVRANAEAGNSSPALRRVLAPYFELLVAGGAGGEAAADLFEASQVLVRPGVAQTQAVLARELSGGSDEAARLFRQSVNLTRDIERTRVELARLEAAPDPDAARQARIEDLRRELEQLRRDQVATQARLADFPRYRAVSSGAISLADMQTLLRDGEAYYKMIVLGDDAYAVFVTPNASRAFRIDAGAAALERDVDALRGTISTVEDGQLVTYPFDVELAHSLYRSLFGPVANDLAGVRHLVFEPDGAMLRLPPNLLVMEQAGVAAYQARAADPDADGFDFTGIEWLGRGRDISTAVSARAFRDVRNAPPSDAQAEYIGFGQNEPASGFFLPAASVRGAAGGDECAWSLAAWNRPISADELYTASRALAANRPAATEIVTGEEFTDTAIVRRDDLDRYRVMHFATHGLVTPPRPECPARPALMTSFGGEQSDGLLSFREIFDLRLDADLIILSACDTAGRASLAATREAGLATGGDMAFDGLVRAFVGAGGRLVLASHWPVPDDFDATERLISGLFTQAAGTPTATALREAQRALMDAPATSHPYYWSGFAVVGDGSAPVIRNGGTAGTQAH